MEKETLKNLEAKLNNSDHISLYRRYSLCQKIRQQILRAALRNGVESDNVFSLISAFNERLGHDLDLPSILSFDFQIRADTHRELKPFSKKFSDAAGDFLEKFKDVPFNFVIHGSHADATVNSFSDFDCSVFISEESVSPERFDHTCLVLRAFDRSIASLDFASHHNSFVFFDRDINCYPQSFMPVEALKTGLSNFSQIVFHIRQDPDLCFESLLSAIRSTQLFLYRTAKSKLVAQEGLLKAVISTYFISLVLFVQFTNSNYQSKQDILKNREGFCFNEGHVEVFDITSRIRNFWKKGEANYLPSPNLLEAISRHLDDLLESLDMDFVYNRLAGSFK
jgi:hypothetical protein